MHKSNASISSTSAAHEIIEHVSHSSQRACISHLVLHTHVHEGAVMRINTLLSAVNFTSIRMIPVIGLINNFVHLHLAELPSVYTQYIHMYYVNLTFITLELMRIFIRLTHTDWTANLAALYIQQLYN